MAGPQDTSVPRQGTLDLRLNWTGYPTNAREGQTYR